MATVQGKALAAGALVMAAGLTAGVATGSHRADPYAALPSSLSLTGVVRDFRERSVAGGHVDFERQPTGGFGVYRGMVKDDLDADGKPVFASTGFKLGSDWKDKAGRARIADRSYIAAAKGDVKGSVSTTSTGAVTNAESLAQWFRDVPSLNSSKQVTLSLVRQAGSNIYTFNDRTDAGFAGKGGFFPINGELFGNSKNNTKNYHFTYELETEFVYQKGKGQVFTFTGDDDVWVFIDGKLVIDIGGVHGAASQTVELDRLSWLQDNEDYKLKFFFAERHRTESNFRMDTTMVLRSVDPPTTTALYD